MQEVHFHGRRSEGHRTLRGHARSTVLDTQTVINSLPLTAEQVPFRVVLSGSYTHTEQALVQRLHVANPLHIREAFALLQRVGHPLYEGLLHLHACVCNLMIMPYCTGIRLDRDCDQRVDDASRVAIFLTRDPRPD